MSDYGDPGALFIAAVQAHASEDFERTADCIDVWSMRLFYKELSESQMALPFRQGLEMTRLASTESPDDDEVRALFVEWLRWISARAKIWRLVDSGELAREVAEALCTPRPQAVPIKCVGVVEEDGRFAHILFRLAIDHPSKEWLDRFPEDERNVRYDMSSYSTASLAQARRQSDGSWRLIASRLLLNVDNEYRFFAHSRDSSSANLPPTFV